MKSILHIIWYEESVTYRFWTSIYAYGEM